MRNVFFAAVFMLAAASSMAQTLPKTSGDPLKDICTSFLEQGGQAVSGNRDNLCTCLVRETQSRLTPQEMEIYHKAGTTGQAPPPEIMNKVLGIATHCLSAR
jgi:hypothetical protein